MGNLVGKILCQNPAVFGIFFQKPRCLFVDHSGIFRISRLFQGSRHVGQGGGAYLPGSAFKGVDFYSVAAPVPVLLKGSDELYFFADQVVIVF